MPEPSVAYDVIVVGAGLAGCAAALSAAESGAAVLLLEKTAAMGGSSLLSAGGMAFAGTLVQTSAGVHDGPEQLRRDLLRMGGGFSDPDLVDAYVDHQLSTFEWLLAQGVQFSTLSVGSGNSVPRVHRTQTTQMLGALRRALEARGGHVLTNTPVERLLRDHDRDPIRAVRVRSADGERTIRVRRAVVLASGGFSRNRELVARFAPSMLKAVPVGGDGSMGDGLRLACALGAGLRDMGFIRSTFGSHPDASGARNLMLHAIFKGAILVNQAGRRFADESSSYKDLGDACLAQPDGRGYQVFDAKVMAKADPKAGPYDFATALDNGHLLEAPTLAALAARIDIESSVLQATVDEYNAAVDGRCADAFGRTMLPAGLPLSRIDAAPFFAYPSVSTLLATYCGLTVDAQARVLDVFGVPIPGLFAAGELCGGLHGANYVSGSSLGKASIFGRVAGHAAAQLSSISR